MFSIRVPFPGNARFPTSLSLRRDRISIFVVLYRISLLAAVYLLTVVFDAC